MCRSFRSFNIPLETPGHLNFWRSVWSTSEKTLWLSAPPNFLVKGKINDRDILWVDQSLKPGLCRPFLLSRSFAKVNFYTSIFIAGAYYPEPPYQLYPWVNPVPYLFIFRTEIRGGFFKKKKSEFLHLSFTHSKVNFYTSIFIAGAHYPEPPYQLYPWVNPVPYLFTFRTEIRGGFFNFPPKHPDFA